MSETPFTIEQLESMLRVKRHAEAEAAKERAASVVPLYAYAITPVDDKFDRIYDVSVCQYRLEGTCINQAEVEAVGGKPFVGGMTYLFNHASGSLIGAFGGGTIFVSGRGHLRHSPEVDATIARLSAFIVANPEGGDVTSIIEDHRASIA